MLGIKQIELDEYFQQERDYCLVDVRTKTEFDRGAIPGSINIPLFNEEERERIGRIYACHRTAAQFLAMDIAGPQIPKFVRRICRHCQGRLPILLCWRGGMRSHAAVQFLNLAGREALQLHGGYHQYRRLILRRLQEYQLDKEVILLQGKSGAGKTELLKELKKQGFPVLDLENLANHRGSAFGHQSGGCQSQKNFDSLLLKGLDELPPGPYLLLEGESRRIGEICLPDFLFQAMAAARIIEVEASLKNRCARILQDYTPATPEARQGMSLALARLQPRLAPTVYRELSKYLQREDYYAFVRLILSDYYDKIYGRPGLEGQKLATITADDLQGAVREIASLLKARDGFC